MTHAIEDKLVVITPVGDAPARPLAQTGTPLVLEAAAHSSGQWSYLADEPSHIHIPRPSRVRRSEVNGHARVA